MRRIRRLKSSLVRLTIRQTLASRALDGKVRTCPVVDAKRHAVRITEIKISRLIFWRISVACSISSPMSHQLGEFCRAPLQDSRIETKARMHQKGAFSLGY